MGTHAWNQDVPKNFMTVQGLEKHIAIGNHKYDKQPTMDSVKEMWINKVNVLNQHFATPSNDSMSASDISPSDKINEGWGLKKPKKVVRFLVLVKDYLFHIFEYCDKTGKRPNYDDICDQLKKARNPDGTKQFKPNDWLSSNQVRSLIANFTLRKASGTQKKNDQM